MPSCFLILCLDPKTGAAKCTGKLEIGNSIRSFAHGGDGKMYLRSEGGAVVVCSAGDEFKVLNRYQLLANDVAYFGTVALSHGQAFVSSVKTLYCVGAKSAVGVPGPFALELELDIGQRSARRAWPIAAH